MSHKILNSITPNDQKESGFNLKEWKTKAYDALTDDFNSPVLIAHLFEAVKFIFALKIGTYLLMLSLIQRAGCLP